MRRHAKSVLTLIATLAGATAFEGRALATPPSGFAGTTIAQGRAGEIDTLNHAIRPRQTQSQLWLSIQKTKGLSDLYVQSNVWQPGGHTGWHTHPGHSLIVVTAGAVTAYEGDDPSCTPHVYTTGMTFVDEGGDHVHILRNEEGVEAKTVAIQIIPAKAQRRVDTPGNPACGF
jgi:quercetin dioxygenase-like cupin family protein